MPCHWVGNKQIKNNSRSLRPWSPRGAENCGTTHDQYLLHKLAHSHPGLPKSVILSNICHTDNHTNSKQQRQLSILRSSKIHSKGHFWEGYLLDLVLKIDTTLTFKGHPSLLGLCHKSESLLFWNKCYKHKTQNKNSNFQSQKRCGSMPISHVTRKSP